MPQKRRRVTPEQPAFSDPVLEALMTLEETELTARVIRPLIEHLHPGRLEYTHSPEEAGRDLVSFGRDALGRRHILCVQVKARPISHGANSIGQVAHVATVAKTQGVTMQNGETCFPNEVWFLTSFPFPEQKRRQVSDTLATLDRRSIKFISGEELSSLLRDRLPELASALVKHTHPNLIDFVSRLSKHRESRVFGLPFDRDIIDFYITTAVSSNTTLANAAIHGSLALDDVTETVEIPLLRLVDLEELALPMDEITRLVGNRVPLHATKYVHIQADIPASFHLATVIQEITYTLEQVVEGLKVRRRNNTETLRNVLRRILDESKEELQRALARRKVSVRFTRETGAVFRSLVENACTATAGCPNALGDDVQAVRDAIAKLRTLDAFVSAVQGARAYFPSPQMTSYLTAEDGIRVRVPQPERLLELSNVLLIDGPAGCGKTTLLRMLAVRLANAGQKVAYLSCAEITPDAKALNLSALMQRFGIMPHTRDAPTEEVILIVDALDEAAFDVSAHISAAASEFRSIVVSLRTAYETSLRRQFLQVSLSPFSDSERGEFIRKWFGSNTSMVDVAESLIREYPDLLTHTRLPLIATVFVALLEHGIQPKTRADVYGMRLDLLLSRWDKYRGVQRMSVDMPEAKRRFLRYLAYQIHCAPGRKRLITTDELLREYEASLGQWGYKRPFDDILKDLTVGSGILVEERNGTYSLGHLTFQEHLAGEYLAHNSRVRDVAKRCGDDWWREPLNFYASIRGDITELVDCLLERGGFSDYLEQLQDMLKNAPYTSAGAVDAFKYELLTRDKAPEEYPD